MRLLVVGTGTGVGKTHVACTLIETWAARGVEAVGLKPIETGVEAGGESWDATSDQSRLWASSQTFHVKRASTSFHVKRPLYAFPDPVSPHLAARRAGTSIELRAIDRWVGEHRAPVVVVETAGGLFSPLGERATNLDLVIALAPTAVLLVAPDRLGVLHDVTASLGLASARGLPTPGLVLSAPGLPDASTGSNGPELARLGIAMPIAEFPRRDPSDAASRAAALLVVDWAERLVR